MSGAKSLRDKSKVVAKRLGVKRLYGSLRATLIDRKEPQRVWMEALPSEVEFWERVLPERVVTRADYRMRVDPKAPICDPLLKWLIGRIPDDTVSMIDVGAGPLTALGKVYPGKKVSITATDPLATEYVRVMRESRIEPPVAPVECRGEDLLDLFQPGTFDIAYARNALDHCVDPVRVIRNMVHLVREGRFVVLRHLRGEGRNQLHRGLHQWNFDIQGGEFVLSRGRGARIRVDRVLRSLAAVTAFEERGWIVCVITKKARPDGRRAGGVTAG